MTDQAMRTFLEACGSAGPLILGVEEPGASGASWRVFDQPFAVVGRDPGSDLFLKDPAVSRHHAYLQVIAGRLFCVDLQSRTGTHWEDEPGLWGWVNPDPGVRIGPFRFRSRDDGPGVQATGKDRGSTLPVPVSRSFEQPELPEATLEIVSPTAGPTTWRASRSLVLIGGSRACKIRLQGEGIANIHASLLRTSAGVFAVDLLGPDGILVNGERVRCARLEQDDELTVGDHKIRVRCGPAGSGRRPEIRAKALSPRSRESTTSQGEGEATESLVRLMLDEFGQIQQQTAERFQDTLMAVLQSFAGIHQEQMGLIREELARIRELTEEQQSLRAQVEVQARVGSAKVLPVLRFVSGEPRAATAGPVQCDRPRKLTIKDDGDRTTDRPASFTNSPFSQPRGSPNEGAFHAKVFDRLAEIQGERQGRWQRLMESLLGKGS